MATPTAADIKARYPELATIPDATVNVAIEDAVPWFSECRWGAFYAQGFAAFVAHMLTVDKAAAAGGGSSGAAGPVSQKSVGDVSVSYATPSDVTSGDAYYMRTAYGQRYLQLRKMIGQGAMAV
jgi:hypothetical protein